MNFRFAFLLTLFFAWTVFATAAPKKSVNDDVDDVFEDVVENLPGENFAAAWPGETRLAEKLPAKTIKDGPDEWIYETQHFQFHSPAPIAISSIRKIAWIFEGTYVANLALPLNAPCNHYQVKEKGKFQAQFYLDRESYQKSGAPANSAGYFRGSGDLSTGKTHVPFSSLGLEKAGKKYTKSGREVNAHTLVHEITHHMSIGAWMPQMPIWYQEGYADYVASSPYTNGRINFRNNRKSISNQVKLRLGGQKVYKAPIDLKTFMTQSQADFMHPERVQFSYGMALALFYYFCHCDGKRNAARLKAYIKAMQAGEASIDIFLDGRSWDNFQKEVSKDIKSKLGVLITFPSVD